MIAVRPFQELDLRHDLNQNAYKNFLARLIEVRKQAGLTQVDVAKRLGKAHSFISKCELGERRVEFVELQQLASIYDKDISFFRD